MPKRAKTPRMGLGAVDDDPKAMVEKAIEEAEKADPSVEDNLELRRAAELGWLAAASTADVLAKRQGKPLPKGFNGRFNILDEVEVERRLRRGVLTAKFVGAQEVLHGECYHENHPKKCRRAVVLGFLEEVKDLVEKAIGENSKD